MRGRARRRAEVGAAVQAAPFCVGEELAPASSVISAGWTDVTSVPERTVV